MQFNPGFDPSIFGHKGVCEAANEAVLNNVHKKKKPNPEINKEIKQLNNYGLTTLVFAQEKLFYIGRKLSTRKKRK
jgi:hypothetical protein